MSESVETVEHIAHETSHEVYRQICNKLNVVHRVEYNHHTSLAIFENDEYVTVELFPNGVRETKLLTRTDHLFNETVWDSITRLFK